MMNNVFYTELRKVSDDIRSLGASFFTGKNHDDLLEGYAAVMELSALAQREGLYSLEREGTVDYDKYPLGNYLKRMIMSVVDGGSAKEIEELAMTLYFSSNLKNGQKLLILMYLNGCIGIQYGESPRIIEERLAAMLPKKITEDYKEKMKQEEHLENRTSHESSYAVVDRLCEEDFPVKSSSEYYIPLKILEKAIISMDDRSIQRLLRDVDNCDIAIFLKGISGEGRRRIFNNLSRRLAIMIAEDMEFMGDVRTKDKAEAAQKIIRTLIRLMDCQEIVSDGDNDYLHMLHGIYKEEGHTSYPCQNVEYTESELEQVFNEYLDVTQRKI